MNLEAVNMNDTRAWTWARISMVTCFATASVVLLASLDLAEGISIEEPTAVVQGEFPVR